MVFLLLGQYCDRPAASFNSDIPSIPIDIRFIYDEWCEAYGKEPDEDRFVTFAENYARIEAWAEETGEEATLNEFADCTEEEYLRLSSRDEQTTKSEDPASETIVLPSDDPASESLILSIYIDWCKTYQKWPDRQRLDTFYSNFKTLEKFAMETGEEMTLSEYADFTEEEYLEFIELEEGK
jgi:hypothetical protein